MSIIQRLAKWLFPTPPVFVIHGVHGLVPGEEERVMLRVQSKDFMTEAALRDRLLILDQFKVTRVEMNPPENPSVAG
jgi:hypothetical protein